MAAKKKIEAWGIEYFKRHKSDDPSETIPGREFLDGCPLKVQAMMKAVLVAVAEAPPPAFSGGGKWEAMHDEMSGFYEVRVDGPQRHHYRLFCILERAGRQVGLVGPSIIIVAGKDKPCRASRRSSSPRPARRHPVADAATQKEHSSASVMSRARRRTAAS